MMASYRGSKQDSNEARELVKRCVHSILIYQYEKQSHYTQRDRRDSIVLPFVCYLVHRVAGWRSLGHERTRIRTTGPEQIDVRLYTLSLDEQYMHAFRMFSCYFARFGPVDERPATPRVLDCSTNGCNEMSGWLFPLEGSRSEIPFASAPLINPAIVQNFPRHRGRRINYPRTSDLPLSLFLTQKDIVYP
jgi:hypothetical protein